MNPYYQRPTLRNGVDLQLRNAFAEGNWQLVTRLAERRAKTADDPAYYEAVRICGESQLDSPREKYAGRAAVDTLVAKGTVVKEIDTVELYEWACRSSHADQDYEQTLGTLRVRLVKADPKNRAKGTMCLQACVSQWDLVNAQQIAATLDKQFPQERMFFFWNILTTFMLSTDPAVPEEKRKIFGMLALRQLDKAADLRENSAADKPPDRAIQNEEEFLLYLRVLQKHGTLESLSARLCSPVFGALQELSQGRKAALLASLPVFVATEDWESLYITCKEALDQPSENGSINLLASDWDVWKSLILAASRKDDQDNAFDEVSALIQKYVAQHGHFRKVYAKVIAQSTIEATFKLPAARAETTIADEESPRVTQIRVYMERNVDQPSCFDDLKGFVEQLTFDEIKQLLSILDLKDSSRDSKAYCFLLLGLKFRYLLTTCPQTRGIAPSAKGTSMGGPLLVCKICGYPAPKHCDDCLLTIAALAVELQGGLEESGRTKPTGTIDILSELAMVAALALVKASGLREQDHQSDASPLHSVDTKRFLQAVLILDARQAAAPDNAELRMLLIQLYLLMGCAHQASQLWSPMDIKRVILDSLAPLFFDRISSVAPGLFRTPSGAKPLMEPLRTYYFNTLRDGAPIRVWDAFEAGNYCSVLDLAEFWDRLKRSCTLVMTVVEDRRGTRAITGKNEVPLSEVPFVGLLNDEAELNDASDFGCLPNLESSFATPLGRVLRVGPCFSNSRSQLDLLSEQYIDLHSYTPPKEYRPAKAAEALARDRAYLLETLARLNNSATRLLQLPDTPSHLTGAEYTYYTAFSLLTALMPLCLLATKSTSTSPTLALLVSSLATAIKSLRASLLSMPSEPQSQPSTTTSSDTGNANTLLAFSSQHTLSVLRDTCILVRNSANYLLASHERDRERDRSGASGGMPKAVVTELRGLETLAAKVLAEDVKDRVKWMKVQLDESGWMDRLAGWALGEVKEGETDADGEEEAVAEGDYVDVVSRRIMALPDAQGRLDDWTGRVLESWREAAKGWGLVKME